MVEKWLGLLVPAVVLVLLSVVVIVCTVLFARVLLVAVLLVCVSPTMPGPV